MTTSRKFRLSDAIVLVAATAIGLAVFKPYHDVLFPPRFIPFFPSGTPFTGWINGMWSCVILASPLAMAWTLAVLALRLRRPRVRWRRLIRQPGLVAGLSAAFVLVWRLSGFATMCARVIGEPNLAIWVVRYREEGGSMAAWPPGWLLFDTDHFLNTMATIGVAIASSWMLLLLSGQWHPERSWIDRAGRVLGCFWIAILPLTAWWDFHIRF